MIILPAIDLFGGQAVRLYQGDYNQMTVYDADPLHTVAQFEVAGATHLHLVDLEGAKTGQTTNLPTIERIAAQTGLFVEVGGGIRSMDTVRRYLEAGASRVILAPPPSPTRTSPPRRWPSTATRSPWGPT